MIGQSNLKFTVIFSDHQFIRAQNVSLFRY